MAKVDLELVHDDTDLGLHGGFELDADRQRHFRLDPKRKRHVAFVNAKALDAAEVGDLGPQSPTSSRRSTLMASRNVSWTQSQASSRWPSSR
jgi:hypothetical protein